MDSLQTLDRAVLVVDIVASEGPLPVAQLVTRTGLPKPTVHRFVVALEQHGLVTRTPEGQVRLGPTIRAWAAHSPARADLVDRARTVLTDLSDETGESAQLYVREGDQRVCIATHEQRSGLRDTVPLGAVLPLTLGSGAKVLLAWASDRDRFDVPTRALAQVRARGWSDSVAERAAGVASVSAPVRDGTGDVVAAISVSGPIERLGRQPGRRLARTVVAAAERLSSALV
ncbi:MAG TPA: IclR family transcriptional regulator [Acidimicrobiia bacterium]|nr:IclR family transcriptional regulator [Acidimicrobiia bacterium]